MKNVGMFIASYMEYFTATDNIFYCPLDYFVVIWYSYFPPFWYVVPRKIWQTWSAPVPGTLDGLDAG
jgi:hypothetical protein